MKRSELAMRRKTVYHFLKTWPGEFHDLWTGLKQFDIRLDDRDFHVGDSVQFREYDPVEDFYSGRKLDRRIIYITDWNQKPNYVVIGLAP